MQQSPDQSPATHDRPTQQCPLKYFSERIPATFVFAGINVERAGLLYGARGEQIAARFAMVRTGPFACDDQWATLIAALEDSLRLHRHQAGTLPQLARYLHQRTGGMIGSLLWLIRSAAIQAVIDGAEQITRKAMDTLQADIASQSAASSLASRVSSGSACGGPPRCRLYLPRRSVARSGRPVPAVAVRAGRPRFCPAIPADWNRMKLRGRCRTP